MSIEQELAEIDSAEDLFDRFEVAYDPRVLKLHRLHVLKLFGIEVKEIEAQKPLPTAEELRRLYGAALEQAYNRCATGESERDGAWWGPHEPLVQLRLKRTEDL